MLTANQSERIISDVTASDGANTPVDFTMYYHTDHLGSTGFLTDATGAVNEHIEYTAWADATDNINMRRAGAIATGCETWLEKNIQLTYNTNTVNIPKYMYTSKELDTQTHLYYFGARYYDPKTSLWVSTDPILGRYLDRAKDRKNNSQNDIYSNRVLGLYSYVNCNPINVVDYDGNEGMNVGFGGIIMIPISFAFDFDMHIVVDPENSNKISYALSFQWGFGGGISSDLLKEGCKSIGSFNIKITGNNASHVDDLVGDVTTLDITRGPLGVEWYQGQTKKK